MKKTISITLTEPDKLELPTHLKKQPILDLQVQGFNDIEALQMVLSCAVGMLNNYKAKVDGIMSEMNNQKPS